MAKSRYIETFEEQYTKKGTKSVLRYKAPDGKWRYIQTSKDASGGNMPSGGGMTEVTWQELKDKRDNGELIPGTLYRITDYQCTTTQENTQSAGHQFDIVLLALSENKLAEEGWAMMHDNIYDVTFNDGVTKKCYLYNDGEDTAGNPFLNVVDIETKLGQRCSLEEFTINESDKTAFTEDWASTELTEENLPYNYFQNSNLSAWKVWYCLDNDTTRFAWADDREGYLISGQSEFGIWDNQQLVLRAPDWDADDLYGWKIDGTNLGFWTKTLDINVGQLKLYNNSGDFIGVATVSSANKVYNGRGVIYRLIDEWNNDVGYDFKNIQYRLRLDNNVYIDGSVGEYTWVYTFDALNLDTDERIDATLIDRTILIDDGYNKISNNFIGASEDYNTVTELPYICFLVSWNSDDTYFGVYGNVFNNSSGCYFSKELSNVLLSNCHFGSESRLVTVSSTFYINNKKVLTEE